MDIYDSYYYRINKAIIRGPGLWPYDNKVRNYFLRTYFAVLMIIAILPQVYSIFNVFGANVDRTLENVANSCYLSAMLLKIINLSASEDKLKVIYESIARNFQTITNPAERKILFEYAERGRLLTIGFILYIIAAITSFVSLPVAPILLDMLFPLNESRQRLNVWDGDYYIIDRQEYYLEIYFLEIFLCTMSGFIVVGADPMIIVIVEHCLALFAIIKYRLKMIKSNYGKEISISGDDDENEEKTYKLIVQIIQLHADIVKFAKLLELSLSRYFLLEMGLSVIVISLTSVTMLIKHGNMFELARYVFVSFGTITHTFYLTWPGQKLIDHSSNLFRYTYTNEWYECPTRCQILLKFMALRCVEPCQLTAGGIYVMNFVNFAAIIKTSVSYITVFSSFR